VLADIANGDFTLKFDYHGQIHPNTWEQIVEHNADIEFSLHSDYSGCRTEDEIHGNCVQYMVYYFRDGPSQGEISHLGQQIDKEPI
jgi:hypothetical protein